MKNEKKTAAENIYNIKKLVLKFIKPNKRDFFYLSEHYLVKHNCIFVFFIDLFI